MEAAVKLLRAVTKLVGFVLFAVYFLYWIMFAGYISLALTTPGGWRLWFDASGVDGLAGPLFLWFLVLFNPATIALLYIKLRKRFAHSNSGVSNVEL